MTAKMTENVLAIHRLRINVKSLAEESRIIRKEVRRAGPEWRKRLAVHRHWRVKPESRLAQLALAFVRGRPYRSAEQSSKMPVLVGSLQRKLKRFGVDTTYDELWNWVLGR